MTDLNDFLSHHGVKGMKWGVRRDDAKASNDRLSNAVSDFYKSKSTKKLNEEGERKTVEKSRSKKAHVADDAVDGSSSISNTTSSRTLTRNQKVAIGVGITVVAAGVLAYSLRDSEAKLLKDRRMASEHFDSEWASLFKSPDVKSNPSKRFELGYYYAGLDNKRALDRPEFTIPKTTQFHRMSDHQETGEDYGKGVYSTFLSNDNKSYNSRGSEKYQLKFTPTEDVRVPSTRTVLSELKTVMANSDKNTPSDEEVFKVYHSMSGSGWDTPNAKSLLTALRSKGYSALVDDMDAGRAGDLPMVFFGKTHKIDSTEQSVADKFRDGKTLLPMLREYS